MDKIISRLNDLLENSKLDEAETLLSESIEEMRRNGNTEAEIYLLNEQIGFFRDCGRYTESLESVDRVKGVFAEIGDLESISYATTLLNCANAYRASGGYEKAFETYEAVKTLYDRLLDESDGRVASYYNNIALLYQQTEQWENACNALEKALSLVRESGDEVRTAISCTNLAVSLLKLDEIEKAETLLKESDNILRGRTPSDFHYSAVLAGFGDLNYKKNNFTESAEFYEQALSEIELHMGTKGFYEVVLDNLKQAYSKLGTERPELSGIELAERYYNAFGEPMLKRNFSDVISEIAVGLVGDGSECLGYDDEFSKDHDFGARFCIFVPDNFPQKRLEELQTAYNSLPKTFMGVTPNNTEHAKERSGVIKIGDFLLNTIGIKVLPENPLQWIMRKDNTLAVACSGKIFKDYKGEFTEIRKKLLNRPDFTRKTMLADELELMAQCGQYNYKRMIKRNDFATAQLYLADFCKSAMRTAHLCRNKYAPYDKWLLKSTRTLDGFGEFADDIERLLTSNEDTETKYSIITQICNKISAETLGEEFADKDIYLAEVAKVIQSEADEALDKYYLVNEIVALEWDCFDKVNGIDGRADCQDDWETFSIMRKSQYDTWGNDLLEKWIEEFKTASSEGRNLITEKYARMMESTDPEKYQELKNSLPELSEDFIKVREAVVGVQVFWIEKFAEKYPNLASRARVIRTSEDTVWQTSYETYLRGELSTYSFDLLLAYAQWITSLYKSGENLAFSIMQNTVKAYGYDSPEKI